MRPIIRGIAYFVAVVFGGIYGYYLAIRLFFDMEICQGNDCNWIFNGWNPILIGAIFVFVFLPLSPLIAMLQGWIGFLLAALLFWIAKIGENKTTTVKAEYEP